MSGTGLTPNAFKQTINTGIYRSANVVSAFCGICTISGFVCAAKRKVCPIKSSGEMHERVIMPKPSDVALTPVSLTSIERPRCGRCQARMMLARISPLPDGSEQRTFECRKCDAIETRTIADPLKSEAIERLTANVRPPV